MAHHDDDLASFSFHGPPGAAVPRWLQSVSKKGPGLAWPVDEITLVPNGLGTDDVTGDEAAAVFAASMAEWNAEADAAGCVGPRLALGPADPAGDGARHDGVNRIVFREDGWASLEASGDVPAGTPYDPLAAALTTVYYRPSSGLIVEADVELNAYFLAFATDGRADAFDLASVVTHELGHVVGLDHSSDVTATMDPYVDPGETEKASLAADDVAGFCAIYEAEAARRAEEGDGGWFGCDVGGVGANGGGLEAALVAALVLTTRWAPLRRSRRPR